MTNITGNILAANDRMAAFSPIMKTIILILFLTMASLSAMAFGTNAVVATPWTTTTNPAVALAALGGGVGGSATNVLFGNGTNTTWRLAGGTNFFDAAAGINGTNGVNGTNGATGPQGIQGIQGATGAAGTNGTNGTGGGTNGTTYTAGTGITILSNTISLYSAPAIASFVNNQNSIEQGATVSATVLNWTLSGGAITNQSINQGIGTLATGLRTATDSASYSANRTYTLTVTDGTTTTSANTAVTFYSKLYWGVTNVLAASITDAQIIALGGSAFATARQTTQTFNTTTNYVYFCYPAAFGAVTSFVNNGFPESVAGWTLVTRNFVNASGGTVSYNIYQHTQSNIGSYTVQVQ